jgi:hypothetical protein
MNRNLLLGLVVLLLIACGPKPAKVMEEQPAPEPEKTEATTDQRAVPEAPNPKPAFVAAGIKKTPCYGSCKVFEVRFDARGYATYLGKSNVKMEGNWRADLSPAQCSMILEKAQRADYFSLSDIYPASGKVIPDLPYTITFVEFGEEKKEIKNNHDAPRELADFEAYLEDLIKELEWRKEGGE